MSKARYGTSKAYHFIYKTTNIITGRYYIGMHSTNDLEDGYLGSGTRLKRSINKYGPENHKIEILEYANTREDLAKRENEIANLDEIAKENCLNLRPGGFGGWTVEQQKLNSIKGKIKLKWLRENDNDWVNANFKSHSNGLKKYYETHPGPTTGKHFSEEIKRKMSESSKGTGLGEKNSQFGTMWITNGKENMKIKKESLIPINWKKGRI